MAKTKITYLAHTFGKKPKKVTAESVYSGIFGVRKEGRDWTLDHVATGLSVTLLRKKSLILELVGELAHLNWDFKSIEDPAFIRQSAEMQDIVSKFRLSVLERGQYPSDTA